MTTQLQDRLNKIRQVKADREQAELDKETQRKNTISDYTHTIRTEYSERIINLITLARECVDNGIDIENFCTNGISHKVGFCNPIRQYQYNLINAIGIDNGGFCGNTHFRISKATNEHVMVYGLADKNDNYTKVYDYENFAHDLKKFTEEFYKFEQEFLHFIDTL